MVDDERVERSLKAVADDYVRANPPDFPAFREAVLRRRRRRIWIQTTSAVAFAGAAVALGLFFTRVDPQGGRSLPPAEGDQAVSTFVRVGVAPSQINVGRNAIWVTSRVPGTLTRIDPVSKETTSISVGGVPSDLAVGGSGVWMTNAGELQHARIPASTEVESYPIASPSEEMHVSISPGAVWVVVAGKAVFRVDPAHPKNMTEVTVTANPVDIAVGDGVVWVLDQTGQVQGYDVKTEDPIGRSISVPTGSNAEITLGANALWYGIRGDTTFVRIDPATGIDRTVTLPSDYVDMGVGRDEVWVLLDNGADRGSLGAVDPATGRLFSDRIYAFSGSPVDVAVGKQALWMINTTGSKAQRVEKDLLNGL